MEIFTEKLTYRPYLETDQAEISSLWQEAGWGGLTPEQFESWFIDTPYGQCIIVVAVDARQRIAGQIIFTPSNMIVEGIEIKALRASAPILNSHFRQNNLRTLEHPAFALIQKGFEVAHCAGYQYVYAFPSQGWLGLLQLFPRVMPNPCETASYDCFVISLEDTETYSLVGNEYAVSVASAITDEYDQLWNDAVRQMPLKCGVVRKKEWLKWAMAEQLKLEVRTAAENELVGYMAIKKETGLIVDVFARNQTDLKLVFQQAVHALHRQNAERIGVPFTQLKGMLTRHMEPVVKETGFTKDSFRFAFGGCLLDTTLAFEKVQAAQWYMMPLG